MRSPGPEVADVGALEGLVYGCDNVCAVGADVYHGEAHPVVRYRLVDVQLVGERAAYGEVYVGVVSFNGHYGGGFFYYS